MLRTALGSGHAWIEGITYERLWDEGHVKLRRPDDWRPFADGGFPTRSGKAELYSAPLAEQGLDPLPAGNIPTGRGLQLITGKALHFMNSSYSHIDRHRTRAGTLFIELHADDARARGVATGDLVRVSSEVGAVQARCQVSDRVAPGVAWMPFGGLADAAGTDRGVNALVPMAPTDWGGGVGYYDAFVEVAPV